MDNILFVKHFFDKKLISRREAVGLALVRYLSLTSVVSNVTHPPLPSLNKLGRGTFPIPRRGVFDFREGKRYLILE
jgi:hypothetical protein